MIILGIDPSVNNVGLALYNTETKELTTRTFHPSLKLKSHLPSLSVEICRFISVVFLQKEKKIDCLVIEMPQWENSQRGKIAGQQGYTLDLAYIVGFCGGRLGLNPLDINVPTPNLWKGQVSKSTTENRMRKRFKLEDAKSDHEFDAIGLVAWFLDLGILKLDKAI